MKELYIEGVAIHGGPESCVGVREGVGEALTGARVGWAIEPRNQSVRGADAVTTRRKATSSVALSRVAGGPCAVGEPGHARNLHAREPGGPDDRPSASMMPRPGWFAGWQIGGWAGREGKAEAVSPR